MISARTFDCQCSYSVPWQQKQRPPARPEQRFVSPKAACVIFRVSHFSSFSYFYVYRPLLEQTIPYFSQCHVLLICLLFLGILRARAHLSFERFLGHSGGGWTEGQSCTKRSGRSDLGVTRRTPTSLSSDSQRHFGWEKQHCHFPLASRTSSTDSSKSGMTFRLSLRLASWSTYRCCYYECPLIGTCKSMVCRRSYMNVYLCPCIVYTADSVEF